MLTRDQLIKRITADHAEAELLHREALALAGKSFGENHPNVATCLDNLSLLLQDTNRLGEAEPLMRRHVEIFLKFTQSTGHQHPHLMDALNNYVALLTEMGDTQPRAKEKVRNLAKPYGVSL